MYKSILVTYKVNDFQDVDQSVHDDYKASFGLLAAGVQAEHLHPVEFHDNVYHTFFRLDSRRVQTVLDLINGLTLFEAEEVTS